MSVLEHYQRRLSTLLLEGRTPAEIREALLRDPTLDSLQSYVRTLQDGPLEVAAALARKWGSEHAAGVARDERGTDR